MTDREAPPELIAAYMEFCKARAADHNEVGLAYFRAAWQASRKQMAEEAAAVCADYADRAKSTAEMFHQGTERRVGWEAKQEAGKTLSVRFKALCRSLATPTEGKT